MSYCITCKRHLNGALCCAGCGAEIGADGYPTMPLPVFRAGDQPSSAGSGSASLPGGGHQPEPGERGRLGLRWGRSSAVAAAAVVTVAVGAVVLTTTGGRQSSAPVSRNSIVAGPGLPAPPLASAGVGGSASGKLASAGAGRGGTASSLPTALGTETAGGGTGAPTSAAPTGTPATPAAGGATSCKATYSLDSSWAGGYQVTVTVADGGSSALNGWTVNLTLANGQSITDIWNGVNTGSSGAISVENASYNGPVAAGGSGSFGFTASGDSAAVPMIIGCSGQ